MLLVSSFNYSEMKQVKTSKLYASL